MRVEGPFITDIHHFALDDGPGIRTTVFLKGCPLSCTWCHNPETLDARREIAFHRQLCIGCGCCLTACPHGAILPDGEVRVARDMCTACGVCAEACPATALRVAGRYYSVPDLTEILLRDRLFYETSGGGVTFSGGEPTLFMDYVAEAAHELKRNGIHTAIQTSGYFDCDEFSRKLLPYLDLIFFDLKIFDPEKHRKFTGVGNEGIFDNFIRLKRLHHVEIVPRIPLVPGITATDENVVRLGNFLKEAGFTHCELLSYNSGGMMKRAFLGKTLPVTLKDARLHPQVEENLKRALTHVLSQKTGKSTEARNKKEALQVENI